MNSAYAVLPDATATAQYEYEYEYVHSNRTKKYQSFISFALNKYQTYWLDFVFFSLCFVSITIYRVTFFLFYLLFSCFAIIQ